jgi:HD-GYP domain-containing protein (c-di-GMP phosphodiesterase class II)
VPEIISGGGKNADLASESQGDAYRRIVSRFTVMEKKIKIDDLKVGMYIILPTSWFKHPFAKNEFSISEKEQIRKIRECGFEEVIIDTAKSKVPGVEQKPPEPQPENTVKTQSVTVVPDELSEAIHDKKLPAQEKAKAVQKHSILMIRNLLDNPSAENIRDVKKGVAEVVDLILTDDDTSYYLMNITSHDFYTYTHSVNVGFLAVSLAKALFRKSMANEMHELGAGFFVHDLGKVHVDPAIINKPGVLTDDEMEQMRKHPDMGHKILLDTNQLTNECRKIVMQHHERFNGMGYPKKLKGDEIHLYGKICSIADVFDALTSDRPYRKKMDSFKAMKLMKEEMLEHFQKDLFEQFVLLFSRP